MAQNQFALLRTRRFLPLFVTQFLGAFNDNLFKNALVILITFQLAEGSDLNPQVTITLAAGIFILPLFLFSATGGNLADKLDKARLIRAVKLAEIFIMVGATIAFFTTSMWLLLGVLFLMGTQSAFFGPAKYGILPEQLASRELIAGNAFVSGATYLAILTGTLLGGLLVLREGGTLMVSAVGVTVAVAGWISSLYILPSQAVNPTLRISYNLFRETWRIMSHAAMHRDIFLAILGISWFWLVGATFLSQLPALTKDFLGANEEVVNLFWATFSIGIGVGALLCNRLLKGAIHATFVPVGALGLSIFTLDFYFALPDPSTAAQLVGVKVFLSTFAGWRILFDLFAIAVAGGLYVVPLNAMVQYRSDPSHRARNIASMGVMNAAFMVGSALLVVVFLSSGLNIPQILLTIGIMNAVVAIYICRLLPRALAKALVAWLLDALYRVEVKGLHHLQEAGERVLIVANHQSFLDAALIAAYSPGHLTFAINTHIAKHPVIKFFIQLAETYAIDPTNPLAMRALIDCLKKEKRVVIFPEGRLTVTGALMKIYEGPGLVADKANAKVLPVRLDGAQYSTWSRMKGKVRIRRFPKIRIEFLPPIDFDLPKDLRGRERRRMAGQKLYDVMSEMVFTTSDYRRTLFRSLLDARRVHGGNHLVAEDVERQPISYNRLVLGAFALGRPIARETEPKERVGVLLPNMVNTAVTFFALQAYGRVPAMLNFSTGSKNLRLACEAAVVKRVLTSRRFVEMGKLERIIDELEQAGVAIVYLEDLREKIHFRDRLFGFIGSRFAGMAYRLSHPRSNSEEPSVVLFTSGTEGAPKGVVLSHANVQSNRFQVSSRIDFGPRDIVFNALPMFHSFGLTCGTILPLLSGIKVFLYPSPLHYRVVPVLAYDVNATIMFGTDTFLAGYARYAHPYDFYSMRYVYGGAEKLKDETRRVWAERFGVRVFEGYGATETSPVLAMNTPMHYRPGAVGRLMPGMEYRLDSVPGIDEGGRLMVKGPNVMLGYLRIDNPGVLEPSDDGWYDTGDIVTVDEDGFVVIRGRAKRFAKIGGEMISLAAVESFVAQLWPDHNHAVVSLPDPKKGEQLVLLSENPDATRDVLSAAARTEGMSELAIPRTVLTGLKIPLLGTGKIDYVGVTELSAQNIAARAA